MAPERLNDGTAEPPSDLWSLGVTLCTAVEGTSPLPRKTVASSIAAVLTAPIPEPRHAGSLAPLITGLLERDPGRRLSAGGALALLDSSPRGGPARSAETGLRSTSGSRPDAGTGSSEDPSAAEEVDVIRAAEAGEAAAMTNLGNVLEERGQQEQAQRWYRRAAELKE